jgi:hypothetical protein
MKGVTNFTLKTAVFAVIFVLFAGSIYAQNSVSGTVRYSDNNDLVTSGTVQAYDLNCNLIASTSINPDGTYMFASLPPIELDIIGFPGLGPEDDKFVPTIYPNKTDWQTAVTVYPYTSLTGIDIYVTRISSLEVPFTASISGKVTLNNKVISDAIVYAQRDGLYYGFAATNDRGEYEIKGLPIGNYILVVHRIGASSATRNLSLTMEGTINVCFNISTFEEAPLFNLNNSAPGEFKLSQNYPNPFNPATKIDYSLPVSGMVKVTVFNSLGQAVKVLVNQVQNSGSYSLTFDGSNLSSGIYYYRIETGSFVDTKKMILVK